MASTQSPEAEAAAAFTAGTALLPAIGIAGMDRLFQKNVIALSGRAIEAAGGGVLRQGRLRHQGIGLAAGSVDRIGLRQISADTKRLGEKAFSDDLEMGAIREICHTIARIGAIDDESAAPIVARMP